jgi:hypothetical protein
VTAFCALLCFFQWKGENRHGDSQNNSRPANASRSEEGFLHSTSRPFIEFVTIVVGDFLRVAVVWFLLYAFDFLTRYLPVAGFAGSFIHAIHQAGSVALVLILVLGLLIDVIQSLRDK